MRLTLVILFITLALPVWAQQPSRAELEKQRMQILETIKQTEEQLASTKKNTKVTMGQLRAIQSKLAVRQKLIGNINQEIGQIGNSISRSNNEIERLKGNLKTLQARYAQSVRYAYKSRSSYDMLAFLFSADDFNEAVRRLKYLKRYRDYRKDQADQIRKTQTKLEAEISSLNTEKVKKDILLQAEEQQKEAIVAEKQETDYMIKELKGREKELMANINKKRRDAKRLEDAVQKIIERELEIARKKAEEERKRREAEEKKRKEEEARLKALAEAREKNDRGAGGIQIGPETYKEQPKKETKVVVKEPEPEPEPTRPKTPVSKYNYEMTPEANALSNNFESNKGRLPYPVEKGFISIGFGRYNHPIAEKVVMDNPGVDIQTYPGAPARAVFDGSVTSTINIPGQGFTVIISHGVFFTVYTQLQSVSVQKGQKVSTKQNIGRVRANDDGEGIIGFQVWQGNVKTDPALWLAR